MAVGKDENLELKGVQKTDQPEQSENLEQHDQSEQLEQSEHLEQSEQPEQPLTLEKPLAQSDDYRESEDEDFDPQNARDEGDDDDDEDEDEDHIEEDSKADKKYLEIQGEGLIKTRSQRLQEQLEDKQFKQVENKASIDVETMFKTMKEQARQDSDPVKPASSTDGSNEFVTIKRTYNFAGKLTTEEKKVLKSSAEAKAYLQTLQDVPAPTKPKALPRRKRSSLEAELANGKAKKMNTLEKSRLDWAGFVDHEGIQDDLTHHNKGGYLQKQDFLARVDYKLDHDYKNAKKPS